VDPEHRKAMLRNLAKALIEHGRIVTIRPRAKALRRVAERLITLGKQGTLHARRQALAMLPHKEAVADLFSKLAPRFADRNGGYTRILHLPPRRGDGAPMVLMEWVDYEQLAAEKRKTLGKAKEKGKKKLIKEEPKTEG